MSKDVFFDKLRDFFLKCVDNKYFTLKDACGYFETIYQHEDKVSFLYEEVDKYQLDFRYEYDTTEGYTLGKISIHPYTISDEEDTYQPYADHHYEIELLYDERYWGYCMCNSSMELYDPVHNCCGDGCDWVAPQISITKIENKAYFTFNGIQRDMWSLQKEWNSLLNVHVDDEKTKRIQAIDAQILELEKRKQMILDDN